MKELKKIMTDLAAGHITKEEADKLQHSLVPERSNAEQVKEVGSPPGKKTQKRTNKRKEGE